MSQAKLEIPIDSLRKLPPRAEYRAESGQANAVVKIRHDTIVVYAICDSLLRMCEYYESEAATYKEAYEKSNSLLDESIEQNKKIFQSVVTAFVIGFVSCLILIIIIKLRKRYGQ